MAERRMFAKTIIDSDAFLEMPITAQCLYFHLAMRADDDGFVNKPKSIMRVCGCRDDDANILIAKKFIIPFDSGVVVIKHWRMHNYIRQDRYKRTSYTSELSALKVGENGEYTPYIAGAGRKADACGIPSGNQVATQVRLGKGRLDKDSIGKDSLFSSSSASGKSITPAGEEENPEEEEVKKYAEKIGAKCDVSAFMATNRENGWIIGGKPVKSWKALFRAWEKADKERRESATGMPESDNADAYKSFIYNA